MHPRAVYCALKGLVPCHHIAQGTPDPYRIKHGDRVLMPTLRGWRLARANQRRLYKEIPWDEIPESALDQLPQKLVDLICS